MKAYPRLLVLGLGAALVLALMHFLRSCLYLNLLVSLGITAAVFLVGRLWRQERAVPLSIPAFGLCLVTAIRLDRRGENTTLSGLCALLVLLLYLLNMHEQGMGEGLHNMPGEPPMAWPRGVRGKNALLVLAFLSLCLGLAALPGVEKGADRLMRSTVSRVETAAGAAAESIKKRTMASPEPKAGQTPEPDPSPAPEEAQDEPEEQQGEQESASVFGRILFTLFAVTAVLLAAATAVAALILCLLRWKHGALIRMSSLLSRLKGRLGSRQQEDYIEEREKLRSWESLREKAGKRIKQTFVGKRRRLRFRDMMNDRQRVRFAYRELLRSLQVAGLTSAMTPDEVAKKISRESVEALTAQYALVRYAPGKPLDPAAGEIAARVIRYLQSGKLQYKGMPEAIPRQSKIGRSSQAPWRMPRRSPGCLPETRADSIPVEGLERSRKHERTHFG